MRHSVASLISQETYTVTTSSTQYGGYYDAAVPIENKPVIGALVLMDGNQCGFVAKIWSGVLKVCSTSASTKAYVQVTYLNLP